MKTDCIASERARGRPVGYEHWRCRCWKCGTAGWVKTRCHRDKQIGSKQSLAAKTRTDHWCRVSKKYGLSPVAYGEMWIDQGYECGICHTDLLSLPPHRVHVDHNHRTGKVRGLLCTGCNTGLGRVETWLLTHRRAIADWIF